MIEWNKVTWYSRLLAIIFFIGVLPMLVFCLGMKYEKVSHSNEVLNIVTNPTPIINTQITENKEQWRKYTNSDKQYEVQIPALWETQSLFNEEIFYTHALEENDYLGSLFSIVVHDEKSAKEARRNLYTQAQYEEWLKTPISNGEDMNQYKIANVTVDGIPAVQYVIRTLPGDPTEPYYSVITWINRGGINYYIECINPEGNDLETYKRILSSFKLMMSS